ncbi:potassium channel protein [Catenovulum sediminis]|uniref:Potassium channel family protein n=1 Tax=Catenovulum sediminis TaxID=1740262 RepID=A0ABV1RF46_9ALTE|nr:potassium channel family protein [Catenovulum sediminis]
MIFRKIVSIVQRHINQFSWLMLLSVLFCHLVFTWLGLYFNGETELTSLEIFPYYYVVTTSTVGYGDFSPATHAGRIWVWIFQIPMGLAIFGAFLGKAGQTLTLYFRRRIMGNSSFAAFENHIVIIGYHPQVSAQIVINILADKHREGRKILLCDMQQSEHPMQEHLEWVDYAKLTSYTTEHELKRIAIDKADRVIIYADTDDQTLTTALKLSVSVKADCHITAWFHDQSKVDLLRAHCPNIECSSSRIAESLVRSMQDPGASRVQEQLLSGLCGDTQYAIQIPDEVKQPFKFEQVFNGFKKLHDATVLAIAKERNGNQLEVNPELDTLVNPGDYIHYIGNYRLRAADIKWSQM